ncbi:ExbD/TolR family protein (plasmid) [Vibrio alginolyticus]
MTTPFSSMIAASRQKKAPTLSLVALMDIFTVLVFFLMFNVHSDQAIEQSRNVLDLPLSTQAIDHLAMDAQVDVLEIPDENTAVFNGQHIALDETLETLTAQVQANCETSDEAPSPSSDEEKARRRRSAPELSTSCDRSARCDALSICESLCGLGESAGFSGHLPDCNPKKITRENEHVI